jgi:hypothetical protein
VNLRRLHSCRRTRDSIIDLVFAEKEEPYRSRLLSEVESCPECLDHYRGLAETLRLFDETVCVAEPTEQAIEEYQERLETRILVAAGGGWGWHVRLGRAVKSNVRIPLPLAAGFVIACLATIVAMAFRPAKVKVVEVPVASATTERIVEVPVITEKVVTRTVYLDRKRETTAAATPVHSQDQSQRVAETDPAEGGGSITRANLSGFQPPSELKIRVIRKGEDGQK